MPEENTTATESQDTSAGDGKNTGDQKAGADTQAAKTSEATQTDITQTDEFKTALSKAVERRLPQLRKQLAKELAGEKEGEPTADEWKGKAEAAESELRTYRAKDQLESFITDKRNNVQVRNPRGLFKLVKDDLEFDDDGKVTNFKEVLAQAKAEAPELFGTAAGSADGGAGARASAGVDMNTLIRQATGRA